MGELLWSIFANPGAIAGPSDTSFVIGAGLAVVVLTVMFMVTVGRYVGRRNRILSVAAGTVFVPGLIVLTAILLLWIAPEGPRPHDASGMLFASLIILSICALPVSLITSAICIPGRRRRTR
jgi:hypothetical protein